MPLGSHGPAGLGTAATGFGAATAMIVHIGMFLALLSAGVADRCAQLAKLGRKWAICGHELHSRGTDGQAVHIRPDTGSHHGHVIRTQTTIHTLPAGNCACLTRFDTFLHCFLSHNDKEFRVKNSNSTSPENCASSRLLCMILNGHRHRSSLLCHHPRQIAEDCHSFLSFCIRA